MVKKGLAVSEGIGIGKAFVVDRHLDTNTEYVPGDVAVEIARYERAVKDYVDSTNKKVDKVQATYGKEQADILAGRVAMISDPYLDTEITNHLKAGLSAVDSVQKSLEVYESMFANSGDEYMSQRAADVRELSQGVVDKLKGIQEIDYSTLPQGTILVANEIQAGILADISGGHNVLALVGNIGGYTSHCAIMARNMGMPAVFEVDVADINDGVSLIVDGTFGSVIVSPKPEQIKEYTAQYQVKLELDKRLQMYKGKTTALKCGQRTEVYCNIGNTADAIAAFESSAEGVGLFRTEFLYMQYTTAPSEDMQFQAYKSVAITMSGKPVVIRTLDVGGDKEIPYLNLPKEENPFLGFRAIRYCLTRPDIFEVQLRAILRASAFGKIKIMLPMISDISEVRQAKAMISKVKMELDKARIAYDKSIKVGIMTETAASVLIADVLAKEVDFFSIGTNDLTQYIMSADRGNSDVAQLCSVYYPAVLRGICDIIQAAKRAKIEVAMCGEAASDSLMLPLLLSWGIDEYSVGAKAVLKTRAGIAQWGKAEADKVANRAMTFHTRQEIQDYLKSQVKKL